MGNAPDRTVDSILMNQQLILHEQFVKEEPLFHVEDIKFPLSTQGMKIVDATGRRVKLAGGNWSGGHMCRHCVDGLECRSLRDIAEHIRYEFKMNCIRLTYSLQLYYDNNIVPTKYLLADPSLQGKTSMQIFDITVQTLTDVGLMVILNNHTSTSQWCCSNDDGDGLWWSREYPQYKFFESTQELTQRYRDNQRVIGIDLRNQLRKAHGVNPTWGDGNPRTDWKRAAKISAELVLKEAPHWLIFVAGLNYQLDLSFVKESPLQLSVPNKLCYTGHFYGFSWPIPSWSVYTYDNFKKKLFNSQTYVRSLGFPYLLGEFGNNQQDIPWKYLMQYIKQTDIDWTYWALDGFKCEREKDQTYGVFTNDFSTARHPEMLDDMISVGAPKSALQRYPEIRKMNLGKSSEQLTEMKLNQKPGLSVEPPYPQKLQSMPQQQGNQNSYLPQQSHQSVYQVFQSGHQWGAPIQCPPNNQPQVTNMQSIQSWGNQNPPPNPQWGSQNSPQNPPPNPQWGSQNQFQPQPQNYTPQNPQWGNQNQSQNPPPNPQWGNQNPPQNQNKAQGTSNTQNKQELSKKLSAQQQLQQMYGS